MCYNDQARKFCSVKITGFCYSNFTVRVTTNNLLVPLFHQKGNNCPGKGNDQRLGSKPNKETNKSSFAGTLELMLSKKNNET